jgi:hypothetical protein
MSPRNGLIVFLVTGLAAVGCAFWMGQRDKSAETARVSRIVTTAGGGSQTTPPPTSQSAISIPPSANGAAKEIYERGNARAAENAKIRQDLASGKPVPLPDSLKVADLPPEPLPPGPLQTQK